MAHKRQSWSRLDNAAIIFPATSRKTDTRVFRFSCGLTENVNAESLSEAVKKALAEFPNYRCVLRKGAFWYYLEQSELEPTVSEESKPPCTAIYAGEGDRLLFEVSYYKKRINLELYHVLADGTGALHFLQTIVYYYLLLEHSELESKNIELPYPTPISDKAADSFRKYYVKPKKKDIPKVRRAYRLRGTKNEDDILNITEVCVSTKQLIEAAHRFNSTMTVYLTALLIDTIHDGMSVSDKRYPVVIMVPVNLRTYFPSDTAKNFFGMISVIYNYSSSSGEFSDILSSVAEQFKVQLTKEKLSVRMNRLASIEHNPFAKIAPLPFKNIVLKAAREIGVKSETVVISNVGRIDMPSEMRGYIDSFSVFASTLKLQLCLCSYGDKLSLGFSSAFVNTDVQRNFVRRLTSEGIAAQVNCNFFRNEESQSDEK